MEAVAWKHFRSGKDYFYVIQLNGIKGTRQKKEIEKFLKDWNLHGEGFNPKDKRMTLLFQKSFDSDESWKSWAQLFPYTLVELGKSGKKKPYKLGLDYINSPRRRKNVR
jgi:hypothetical protein